MTTTWAEGARWAASRSGLALAALLAIGCDRYPGAEGRFDDDIVATGYDQTLDFGAFRTFSVDPTVRVIKDGDDGDPVSEELDPDTAAELVGQVVANMESLGYEEVSRDDDPDLGITITGINSLVSGSITWWGGSYWGYWGWGYYYPYVQHYSYRTGALTLDMVDLTRTTPPPDDAGVVGDGDELPSLPVAWNAIAYQVLDDNERPRMEWALESIDQAFEQSPVLGSK